MGYAESFARDGYVIVPGFWDLDLLAWWEETLVDVFAMQARKAGRADANTARRRI